MRYSSGLKLSFYHATDEVQSGAAGTSRQRGLDLDLIALGTIVELVIWGKLIGVDVNVNVPVHNSSLLAQSRAQTLPPWSRDGRPAMRLDRREPSISMDL